MMHPGTGHFFPCLPADDDDRLLQSDQGQVPSFIPMQARVMNCSENIRLCFITTLSTCRELWVAVQVCIVPGRAKSAAGSPYGSNR